MSDALSQIPEAVAAAAVLLTVYYWGRQGHGRIPLANPGPVDDKRKARGQTKVIQQDFTAPSAAPAVRATAFGRRGLGGHGRGPAQPAAIGLIHVRDPPVCGKADDTPIRP